MNKFLLGATKYREIVFANIDIRNGRLSVSFDVVSPFREKDIGDAIDYYEDLLDSVYDNEQKYEMCERYNCTPLQLPEELCDDWGSDVMDIRDCSLYPEIIDVDGEDWYFESSSCGQCNTRNDMEVYTNKELYDTIHEFWDEFHLRDIPPAIGLLVEAAMESLSTIDIEEWITNYIRSVCA